MNAKMRTHETSNGRQKYRSEPVVIKSSQGFGFGCEETHRYSRVAARVLRLDITGRPQDWISVEDAAGHIATDSVAWYAGDSPLVILHGGTNARSGQQSTLEIPPIIALRGQSRINLHDCVPTLTNAKLFKRDRNLCCYCMDEFGDRELTRDHIIPTSRGGQNTWLNTCSSCKSCNSRKGSHLLSEIGMELGLLPYVPSVWEDVLLRGRNIRADVHEWLAAKLPKGSRLN